MHYKLYSYEIENRDGRSLGPDSHFDLFNRSKGPDEFGNFAEYRNRRNAVLMHIQKYGRDFAGLIGKHSTEREVTRYDKNLDVTEQKIVGDDDYPHAAFMCFPRIRMIACVDGAQISANSAISRLHSILIHRQQATFVAEAMTEKVDLRLAVDRFKLTEVDFEVLPVNPHTGDLGQKLDESRKKDHIRKIVGKMLGDAKDPLQLNGGFLNEVQQLQASGHSRVGFVGIDDHGTQIKVPKPKDARELAEDEEKATPGTSPEIRITLPDVKLRYPFSPEHVQYIRSIASFFVDSAK